MGGLSALTALLFYTLKKYFEIFFIFNPYTPPLLSALGERRWKALHLFLVCAANGFDL